MIRRRSRDDDLNSFEANGSHKQHDEQYQSIRKKTRPTVDFTKSPMFIFVIVLMTWMKMLGIILKPHSRRQNQISKSQKVKIACQNLQFLSTVILTKTQTSLMMSSEIKIEKEFASWNKPIKYFGFWSDKSTNVSYSIELREIEISPWKTWLLAWAQKCNHVLRWLKDLGERRLNEDSIIGIILLSCQLRR